MDPYRKDTFPSWSEEDLWLRLDDALEISFRDITWAYSIAWSVVVDSAVLFPDVLAAAVGFIDVITARPGPTWMARLIIREN